MVTLYLVFGSDDLQSQGRISRLFKSLTPIRRWVTIVRIRATRVFWQAHSRRRRGASRVFMTRSCRLHSLGLESAEFNLVAFL